AGSYFKKIMKLQHDYKEIVIESDLNALKSHKKRNRVRAVLSLNELYHLLSDYGENYIRPFCLGMIIVFMATSLFYIKSNIHDLTICSHQSATIIFECIATIPLP